MARRSLLPPLALTTLPLAIEAAPSSDNPMPNPNAVPTRVLQAAPTPLGVGLSLAQHDHVVVPSATTQPPPTSQSKSQMTGIFISTVLLGAISVPLQPEARFAKAFNNSSPKMLRYIAGEQQNGEIVVRPMLARCKRDRGYGKQRPLEVIEGGPWLFQGQPIVLQRWESGMALWKHRHTQVPVWIKLRHLSVEFWIPDGLSTVASGAECQLYLDAIIKACRRLDFARVCVMLDFNSTLPKHLVVLVPRDDGSETPCLVDIDTNGYRLSA
ncbi:UNVERIFIED_CONTAM: hypothetical protein Slati_2987600 [Sesamum latifolium]|uniref:DUF4283 domain-containing protein n=1 Tax=Sesamum latifolium TaxID=2727402 RepID=A0AAW2VG59_9LAMI